MARMKTFFKYLIWVILFFIFSKLMIYIALNSSYDETKVEIKNPVIKQAYVQATNIDGVAKLKLVNDTDSDINNKYIMIDCYSKNNVQMGTKYIKIDELLTNEEKEFEIRFNYNKVDSVIIDMVDDLPQDVESKQLFSDKKRNLVLAIAAIAFLIYFG